jgi:hypothetical protein
LVRQRTAAVSVAKRRSAVAMMTTAVAAVADAIRETTAMDGR